MHILISTFFHFHLSLLLNIDDVDDGRTSWYCIVKCANRMQRVEFVTWDVHGKAEFTSLWMTLQMNMFNVLFYRISIDKKFNGNQKATVKLNLQIENLSISVYWHELWQFNKLISLNSQHKFHFVTIVTRGLVISLNVPFSLFFRCSQINLQMFHSAFKRDSLNLMKKIRCEREISKWGVELAMEYWITLRFACSQFAMAVKSLVFVGQHILLKVQLMN